MYDPNDKGLVYYYEPSKPHHFPSGYGKERKNEFGYPGITLAEGSLFNMCLKYIMVNMNLLDSLIGFPEVVAKQMLDFMIDQKFLQIQEILFKVPSSTEHFHCRTLKLFDDAYGSLFLESLSLAVLKDQTKLNLNPLLSCFTNIKELDLSNVGLTADDVRIVPQFNSLEKLILKNTNLTDQTINKLTVPFRMYKEKSEKLKVLDLQGNPISNRCLELVVVFPKLQILNLSSSNVQMKFELVYELKQFGWQFSTKRPEYDKVVNKGWAAPIVEQVLHEAQLKSSSSASKASLFYKKATTNPKKECNLKEKHLVLVRSRCVGDMAEFNRDLLKPIPTYDTSTLDKNKKKIHPATRALKNNSFRNVTTQGQEKRKFLSPIDSSDEETEDICKQYAQGSIQTKKKRTLLDALDASTC